MMTGEAIAGIVGLGIFVINAMSVGEGSTMSPTTWRMRPFNFPEKTSLPARIAPTERCATCFAMVTKMVTVLNVDGPFIPHLEVLTTLESLVRMRGLEPPLPCEN
jgi:hypothetical protein